jgi:uncharacterized protein
MIPWLYLRIRRSKAGGMHLRNCKELKTGKDLKCPAARLTCPVSPVLSRLFISLEKNGGLRAWRIKLIFMQKPNLTLLKESRTMALNKNLIDILVCPKCRGSLLLNEKKDGLICERCRLLYEIRNDIPVMLIDEAKPI